MDTKYHIKDNCIYFNCNFNEPLDNYTDIIKNCTCIVFSNYDDYDVCIKIKNQYEEKYYKNYKHSKFNQPLGNSLNQLTRLKELTFGDNFNCPLENSLNHLTNLKELTFIIVNLITH